MDGNEEEEYNFGLLQSKILTGKVITSPLNRRDAIFLYMERWPSSVGYFLPITQFDEKHCKEIQMPFLNAILPKMGFN